MLQTDDRQTDDRRQTTDGRTTTYSERERVFLDFTALHEMQTRSSDENSVGLSVRLSVCQTRKL